MSKIPIPVWRLLTINFSVTKIINNIFQPNFGILLLLKGSVIQFK